MAAARHIVELDHRTDDLTDAFLQCRMNGHAWNKPMVQTGQRRVALFRIGVTEIRTGCGTCGSVRTQTIGVGTGDWRVISTKIEYPDGYLLTVKGEGKLPRNEARGAWFMRQMGWA